jgi:hypothetical protein
MIGGHHLDRLIEAAICDGCIAGLAEAFRNEDRG